MKYADENKIDLILLSAHGRSGINIWDLGDIAYKVIHAAQVPVWLVPNELREEIIYDKLPKRTIVVPLDGSKLSEAVIPHAINIAKQRGAEFEMVLVHVQDPTTSSIPPYNVEQIKNMEAESQEKKKYLDSLVEKMGAEGIKAQAHLLTGEPARTIIDFVKNNPAQLIAMTTHAHAGISRMIFGSVTENVIHLVKKTPILLVRP